MTDSARLAEDAFAVAAVLPRTHWFYSDRPEPAPGPMALLEACRQACTVVVHRYFDVPAQTAFLVGGWRLEFNASTETELVLHVRTSGMRRRKGVLSALRLDLEVTAGGEPVGTARIDASYLATNLYTDMRNLRRTTTAPLSGTLPATRAGTLVPAAQVGRRLPENVLLTGATREAGGARATLDVPVDHACLYDHPLDHVPAMALMEAAQQAAVYAAGGGAVRGLRAGFTRIVELDEPTAVEAATGSDASISVEFRQAGLVACQAEVTLR